MKARIAFFLAFVVAAPAFAAENHQATRCNASGNQMELDACAADHLAKANGELNEVYKRLLATLSGDSVALKKVKAAQRIWIQLRDADLAAQFPVGPNDNPEALYGSIYPMAFDDSAAEMTRQRAAYLRKLLQQFKGSAD